MYGESTFTWEYVCGYERRERRKRRLFRRIYGLSAAVCIVCLTAMVSVKFAEAGGVRVLSEKLWNRGDAVDLPFDREEAEMIRAEEIVLPLAAVMAQTAVFDEDGSGQPMAAHIPTVYLDPGHGGTDEGCARAGVREKDLNLAIALLVRDQLIDQGYRVIMSRDTDTYIAKEARVEEANRSGADIYISIHQNATEEGAGVNGMEVWYTEDDDRRDSKRLAQLIRQQTLKSTGAAERELRGDADFYVTGNTSMPACLIETGFLSNTAERRKLSLAEYQQQIADGIVQGVAYYFHPKTMYLTFDDGPSEENTRKVLDILRERNIKATFFLVGENVRKHPEVARQIVAEGHTIGIHCDNHDYEALYESVDSYVADFEKARQTVYEVTGVETNLFRFPGGSVNAYNQKTGSAIIREMTDRGYIYYDWNASLEDAVKNPDPKQLVENGVSTTLGRKKVVLLAHDVVGSTCLCLEELLDSLPEYKMEPLSEDVEPI
ncbi:MAG: N-acetylmuramoyl-L-alanine amidase, partial [Lachnospiraceae bacterium]|nr:N-acetylmuramoyl-L-alanine amidase [Lachnospiraceae bacterium]